MKIGWKACLMLLPLMALCAPATAMILRGGGSASSGPPPPPFPHTVTLGLSSQSTAIPSQNAVVNIYMDGVELVDNMTITAQHDLSQVQDYPVTINDNLSHTFKVQVRNVDFATHAWLEYAKYDGFLVESQAVNGPGLTTSPLLIFVANQFSLTDVPQLASPYPSFVTTTSGAAPVGLSLPSPAAGNTISVTALPAHGSVTLSGVPVTVGQALTPTDLSNLQFAATVSSSKADTFAYTLTDSSTSFQTYAEVGLLTENIPHPVLAQPACTAAGMEPAGVDANDSGTSISFLQPRTAVQPSEVMVLVNDSDVSSLMTGQYILDVYGLSSGNIFHTSIPNYRAFDNFIMPDVDFAAMDTALWAAAASSIQEFAVAWSSPWYTQTNNSFTTRLSHVNPSSNSTFTSATTAPFTDFGVRPSMMVAGSTRQNVIDLIDRGARAQQTIQPAGTGYMTITGDFVRSNVRASEYQSTVNYWTALSSTLTMICWNGSGSPGFLYTQCPNAGPAFITSTNGVLMYLLGNQGIPAVSSNSYVDGAMVDTVNSLSGTHDAMLEIVDGGATATAGTVSEPTATPVRFSDPTIFMPKYFYGSDVLNPYFNSVSVPDLWIAVGTPFARPFGTKVIISGGQMTVTTSALHQGSTYRLQAASSCGGTYSDLVTGISISQAQQYKAIGPFTANAASHPYFRLVTP